MVGVPKSTGCLICRKRKIKCDESWPKCNNCNKNGKVCPGRPSRHTFRHAGQKPKAQISTGEPEETSVPPCKPKRSQGSLRCTKNPDQGSQLEQATQVGAKQFPPGVIVYKFRPSQIGKKANKDHSNAREHANSLHALTIAPPTLYKPPSSAGNTLLAQALVYAIEIGGNGYGISALGSFLCLVPPRIGHNAALDAAIFCLVQAHSAMLHSMSRALEVDPRYCLNAVQKLQLCLQYPEGAVSSNTLCAALVLSLLEALTGPQPSSTYLTHLGGAGRLLEILGPENCRDAFANKVLHFARGGAIITAIYKREECFLTRDEWYSVAFDTTNAPLDERLWTDVERAMAILSTLQKKMSEREWSGDAPVLQASSFPMEVYQQTSHVPSSDPFEDTSFLRYLSVPLQELHLSLTHKNISATPTYPPQPRFLQKMLELRGFVASINAQLATALHNQTFAFELPSIEPSNPVPTSYAFIHWRIACVYTSSWAFTILANKHILELLDHPSISLNEKLSSTPLIRYTLDAECRHLALELCKTWESAWVNRPIGACHVWLGFVVAYEYSTSEVQLWILACLNRLLEEQGVRDWAWTEALVGITRRKLMGEGDFTRCQV